MHISMCTYTHTHNVLLYVCTNSYIDTYIYTDGHAVCGINQYTAHPLKCMLLSLSTLAASRHWADPALVC